MKLMVSEARNILLFTLLIDNEDGLSDTTAWNIYYHLFLDPQSLEVLEDQSKKLYTHAASMQGWHNSKYGRLLRFCDQGTLARVREIWKSYDISELTEEERTAYNKRFEHGIQKVIENKEGFFGSGTVLTGIRSAAPAGVQAVKDLPALYQHFWDHGITDQDPGIISHAKHPNPMFASMVTDTFTLHYGADPLLGFHLATAYVPLTAGSPLQPGPRGKTKLHKVVETAQIQFRAWAISFRKRASDLTLRFFAGDALAFCHTLQQISINKDGTSANWYRGSYRLHPLVLDGEDFVTTGKAPLSFNMIDTSNLVDHLGALNVLVAASPLLTNSFSASLYTESLVKREQSHKALMENFFSGHFRTISILLGLFPVEYWTAATAVSSIDEDLFSVISNEDSQGQMRSRLAWKRSIPECISGTMANQTNFEAHDLARILYQVYQGMFQHEDMEKLTSKLDINTVRNNLRPHYHRGSFVAFLHLIKWKVKVDWGKTMETLLDLIVANRTIILGMNYFQELIFQLRLFGVHSTSKFSQPVIKPNLGSVLKGLSAWKDLPEFVCISLKIPRAKLEVFTSLPPTELGTPIVNCAIQSPPTSPEKGWHSMFAAVQLVFGNITTSGSRHSDEFKVHVAEDELGWEGSSPLLVSFYAPTAVVLHDPQSAIITFGVHSTPHALKTLAKTLGLKLNVHTTNFWDEENVYISKYRPNQTGHPSLRELSDTDAKEKGSSNKHIRTTITANVDRETSNMVGLTGRVDFLSENAISTLRDGAQVKLVQVSPCIIDLFIGKGSPANRLYFPAPVLQSRSKTRIARKSSYVEIEAPICSPTDKDGFPRFMYPLFLSNHKPVIWNMPYLKLDCQPILDTSKTEELKWLNSHTSLQFSTRERTLRDKSMESDKDVHNDVRINFKDSLFSLFMHFTGLQGGQSRVFGLNHPTKGGVHIIFFISCLRLELANHTVILDAAVLPLTDQLVPRIHPFLQALTKMGMCSITVDDEELNLWKEVLPAMVERCRQWEHRPSCEYKSRGRIPLSVEGGQPVLCSCGNGTLPPKFVNIPEWDIVSKYAVRAAISPSFSVPYVEPNQMLDGSLKNKFAAGNFDSGCRTCGKEKSRSGGNLSKCSRCGTAKYCSGECQRADWKEHKKVCSK